MIDEEYDNAFAGHHIAMRRKSSTDMRRARLGFDVRSDTKQSHLAIIGAVTIAWNDVEAHVDAVLCGAIDAPGTMRLEITSRIYGFDGKIAIIKSAAKNHVGFSETICKMIENTCGACEEHKRYRDGIVHARMLDPDDPIAETSQRKGKTDEVLVTEEALNALYNRLIANCGELSDVLSLIYLKKQLRNAKQRELSRTMQSRIEQSIRHSETRFRDRQKGRLSLPPLPKFPEGH